MHAPRLLKKAAAGLVALAVAAPTAVTLSATQATPAAALANSHRALATELRLGITTGADGINANSTLRIVVRLTDGTVTTTTLTTGVAWTAGTKSPVVSLGRNMLRTEIKQLELVLTSPAQDYWDLKGITVDAVAPSTNDTAWIVSLAGDPVKRMSSTAGNYVVQLLSSHTPQLRPAVVDLRSSQTPVRNQGNRRTCIVHAALAATEAAYMREGGWFVDLSEEFVTWTGKTMFLEPNWTANVPNAMTTENQIGVTDGGNALETLKFMVDGLPRAEERLMPYVPDPYPNTSHPLLADGWSSSTLKNQRNANTVNLDTTLYPEAARTASQFYGVTSIGQLMLPALIIPATQTTPTTTTRNVSMAEIEAILASNREVAVDLWRLNHAVLLMGYDRTSQTVRIKDSGGAFGFNEQVAYSRVTNDIHTGGFVTGIRQPGAWGQMNFVGRWALDFDGWRGTLDITHIPGVSKKYLESYGITTTDNRIGSFYDQNGNAFRVNGSIRDTNITFRIDPAVPNLPFNQLSGREFNYTLQKTPGGFVMSGFHTDPGGGSYAGFARKNGTIEGSVPLAAPLSTASYLNGTFAASWWGTVGTVRLQGSSTPSGAFDVIHGTFQFGSTTQNVDLMVERAAPSRVTLSNRTTGVGYAYAWKLNHEPGILAGPGLVLTKTA